MPETRVTSVAELFARFVAFTSKVRVAVVVPLDGRLGRVHASVPTDPGGNAVHVQGPASTPTKCVPFGIGLFNTICRASYGLRKADTENVCCGSRHVSLPNIDLRASHPVT